MAPEGPLAHQQIALVDVLDRLLMRRRGDHR